MSVVLPTPDEPSSTAVRPASQPIAERPAGAVDDAGSRAPAREPPSARARPALPATGSSLRSAPESTTSACGARPLRSSVRKRSKRRMFRSRLASRRSARYRRWRRAPAAPERPSAGAGRFRRLARQQRMHDTGRRSTGDPVADGGQAAREVAALVRHRDPDAARPSAVGRRNSTRTPGSDGGDAGGDQVAPGERRECCGEGRVPAEGGRVRRTGSCEDDSGSPFVPSARARDGAQVRATEAGGAIRGRP